MARIPESELEQLKRNIDLVALIRSKGITLNPHGKDLIGLCPFHDDNNPSLVVTPSKNLWHCLGACNAGGSVIDWIMRVEGVSFKHAVELLRSGNVSQLLRGDGVLKKNTVPRLAAPVKRTADDQALLNQVVSYYQERLKQTPAALKYLGSRGIKHEEALDRFRLGFSDRTLGIRLPHKNRQEGKELRERLQRLGIIRESGHEHFTGSVVFPVFDENGTITEIYGRKVLQTLRKGTPYHTYLPGPHRGIWNASCLTSKDIILCESIIDALSFWVHGFRHVTTSYGTGGFTDELLTGMIDHGVRRVYIAYDRDEAGNTAAERLAPKLNGEGIETLRVLFPKNMDANGYIRSMKPPEKSLKLLLDNAGYLGKRTQQGTTDIPAPSTTQPPAVEPLPATDDAPAVPKEKVNVPAKLKGEDVLITLGDRNYRIRGLYKNLTYEVLKVNVRVMQGHKYYIDTLDLYNARHRTALINAAASELDLKADVIKRDLGRVLLKLEELQEANIAETLKPKQETVQLTDEERKAAMALLKDPHLVDRITNDVAACGIVGEGVNVLTGYLAAVSRKLDRPLGVIVQSSSAAGKSSLMDAILALMPPEDRVKYSAMTGQSLFYMGETDLKHKILAIVEEEGAERASYALKLLQSEGELTIASTGKDPSTGKLITHEYRVEGPVMIFLTTTAVEIDEELQNRCLVLAIDEGREQTAAIHKLQREQMTLEGLLASERKNKIQQVHRNAQRLLRPLKVVNPYAKKLTFIADRTRTRRDHVKYLSLINSIALLHQYQRPIKQQGSLRYLEVTLQDIETANKLAHEVLGRSLDELPPQSRRLLLMLDEMVSQGCQAQDMERPDYRFTRREIRQYTQWTEFQVRVHLARLVSLEYVLVHHGGRGQSFVYELLYNGKGQEGERFMIGLIDIVALKKGQKHRYDTKFEGQNGKFEPPLSPQCAPIEGGVCVGATS